MAGIGRAEIGAVTAPAGKDRPGTGNLGEAVITLTRSTQGSSIVIDVAAMDIHIKIAGADR